jgi:hypothetical protein
MSAMRTDWFWRLASDTDALQSDARFGAPYHSF